MLYVFVLFVCIVGMCVCVGVSLCCLTHLLLISSSVTGVFKRHLTEEPVPESCPMYSSDKQYGCLRYLHTLVGSWVICFLFCCFLWAFWIITLSHTGSTVHTGIHLDVVFTATWMLTALTSLGILTTFGLSTVILKLKEITSCTYLLTAVQCSCSGRRWDQNPNLT